VNIGLLEGELMLPSPVMQLRDFIANEAPTLSADFEDGRTNAAINEKELIKILDRKFDIEKPRSREWWDITYSDKNQKFPINIKVSNLHGNDNVQCKLGIYYALTGVWPTFPNEISWENFFRKMSEDMDTFEDRDYYFIIVNKENSGDVIATSLKSIRTLVPNGNNLPFQCNWGSNRNPIQRSHAEAKSFILGNLSKSCNLRSRIQSEFEEYLGKYV
jgi:hypothetical protein